MKLPRLTGEEHKLSKKVITSKVSIPWMADLNSRANGTISCLYNKVILQQYTLTVTQYVGYSFAFSNGYSKTGIYRMPSTGLDVPVMRAIIICRKHWFMTLD